MSNPYLDGYNSATAKWIDALGVPADWRPNDVREALDGRGLIDLKRELSALRAVAQAAGRVVEQMNDEYADWRGQELYQAYESLFLALAALPPDGKGRP